MEGQTVSIQMDAPPERVYDLVSDVTRMGEWSPVNHRCEWIGGSTKAEPGARFKGHNKQGPMSWSRECEIREADRGKTFAFSTYVKGKESTRWRYTFEPAEGGTKVTESYEPVWAPTFVRIADAFMGKKMVEDSRKNIETSLESLKQAAEQEAKPGA